MSKVIYNYDGFQLDTYKDDYILSMRVAEDDGDVIYQLQELPKEELARLYKAIGKAMTRRTYTTMYEGRPVYKTDDIQGDSQYDWMEQAKFKYQRDDLVEWKSKSGISRGNIIEAFQAPDQVYYSVYVEAGGYELIVSVPEKELKKVV